MIDLTPEHLDIVKKILHATVPLSKVLVFGSRAKGSAGNYSDLDLAIQGSRPLTPLEMYDLKEAFDDSDLPFRVDVLDWQNISDEFREEIKKQCEVLSQPLGA